MSILPRPWLPLLALISLLPACGLSQRVADSAHDSAVALFQKPLNTLHLDFRARPAANTDASHMQALAVPTLVRVYQLRDGAALASASYAQLLGGDRSRLQADWLAEHSVVVKPGAGAQLRVPLAPDARVVAVVGLFRTPDAGRDDWRLLLGRDDLDPDTARVIELGEHQLQVHARPGDAS